MNASALAIVVWLLLLLYRCVRAGRTKQGIAYSQDDTNPRQIFIFFQASSNVMGSHRFTVLIVSDPFRTKTSM